MLEPRIPTSTSAAEFPHPTTPTCRPTARVGPTGRKVALHNRGQRCSGALCGGGQNRQCFWAGQQSGLDEVLCRLRGRRRACGCRCSSWPPYSPAVCPSPGSGSRRYMSTPLLEMRRRSS
jgi:hypothetical protein